MYVCMYVCIHIRQFLSSPYKLPSLVQGPWDFSQEIFVTAAASKELGVVLDSHNAVVGRPWRAGQNTGLLFRNLN